MSTEPEEKEVFLEKEPDGFFVTCFWVLLRIVIITVIFWFIIFKLLTPEGKNPNKNNNLD